MAALEILAASSRNWTFHRIHRNKEYHHSQPAKEDYINKDNKMASLPIADFGNFQERIWGMHQDNMTSVVSCLFFPYSKLPLLKFSCCAKCLGLGPLVNYKPMVIMSSAYSFNLPGKKPWCFFEVIQGYQRINGVSSQVLCRKACDKLRACGGLNENVPIDSGI